MRLVFILALCASSFGQIVTPKGATPQASPPVVQKTAWTKGWIISCPGPGSNQIVVSFTKHKAGFQDTYPECTNSVLVPNDNFIFNPQYAELETTKNNNGTWGLCNVGDNILLSTMCSQNPDGTWNCPTLATYSIDTGGNATACHCTASQSTTHDCGHEDGNGGLYGDD